MSRAILYGALSLLLSGLAAPARADEDLAPRLRAALVRLHVTRQAYERSAPWKLGRASTRESRGVVVQPGVILTKAANVADQRMIEISVANSARRYPGRLRHTDPRRGLALVEFDDATLAESMAPLELGEPVKLDDELTIHQLGADNVPEHYDARVIRATAGSASLSLHLKTTCSDTGNGQVALKDGRIVGLLTNTIASRQQGTIVALESIRHYLADFEDDAYNGPPGPGFWTVQLLRRDLRTFYGLGDDQHGIAVTRVLPGRTGDGVLRPGDVVLGIDGYEIDDEGKFVHEVHGRLSASYLLSGRRNAGDIVKARILRKGATLDVELDLKGQAPSEKRIPDSDDLERPQFLVVGGLVILELTAASSVSRSAGGVILRRFRERSNWDPPTERRRMVYVDRVLQDKANEGFEELYQAPIRSINGVAINSMPDVAKALEQPEGDVHVFRFEGLESDFVLPVAEREAIDARIAAKYKVTLLRYIED